MRIVGVCSCGQKYDSKVLFADAMAAVQAAADRGENPFGPKQLAAISRAPGFFAGVVAGAWETHLSLLPQPVRVDEHEYLMSVQK